MKVQLGSKRVVKTHTVEVSSLREAARAVRDFIEAHDCTAGCGSDIGMFVGGEVFDEGEMIARVSYNGRVWDLDQKEIVL